MRTALAQIVAEELDVAFERVAMVLGDSAVAPDQGPTIASETIQLSAKPLQIAAAQARHWLIGKAAEALGVPAADLVVEDGVVQTQAGDNRRVTYGELIGGERIRLALARRRAGQARLGAPHRGRVAAAGGSSGQGHRRARLCSRHAPARHAARARRPAALCGVRFGRSRRALADRRRPILDLEPSRHRGDRRSRRFRRRRGGA